jgi:ABC-2 type transport system ATP-binding protein
MSSQRLEEETLIEVKNLVKRYGSHAAVDDLSFSVEPGKVVGFLGPNGAGKSTTMNMITGYIAPTEGTVLVDGIDVTEEPEKAKKKIGYLPEIPSLYPDMRVREYLYFVAELKKVKKGDRDVMVTEIMDKTKVTDVSERLIRHLSKGYKQRVGLAGAMMGYPDILILDEPTVGLDPGQIIQMRELIRELSNNHTIILSSHIMQEISAVCDEIIIINEGKMIASDTPDNLTMRMASNGLHLIIKGDSAVIKNALRQVTGIKNVVYDEAMEEGTLGLTLYSIDKKDLREDVFFALAESSCPILEMHRMETSLEEAFLALTKGGSRQHGGKKAAKEKVVDSEIDVSEGEEE